MSRRQRWVVFAVILGVVLVWAATAGEGNEAAARSFLRNLFRAMF